MTCFVYLAVILDAFSWKAVGRAVARHIDTRLTPGALRMAIHRRQPAPGCIHHSDRGVHYASGDYVNELISHSSQISMSTKDSPRENAYAESFIKNLKREEVELQQ